MSKLLITVGGTGSRGGSATLFGMAANMSDWFGDLYVMCMDKDTQNGTTSKFGAAMDSYDELTKMLDKVDGRRFARFDIETKRKSWTIEGILGKSGGDTLESYCAPHSHKYLELFYSEKERRMTLKNGFERHPNIGSLVFEGIKANPNFIKKIEDVLRDGERADIFIIGSIFGGTGASMFVNIAEYIREQAKQLRRDVRIGGALLLPYFNIPQAPQEEMRNDPVTDDDINEATQTALGYYANIPNLVCGGDVGCEPGNAIFDALYVTGLQPRCRILHERDKAVYAKGGAAQDSECNIVDLLVASAACRFFDAVDKKNNDLEIGKSDTRQNLFIATLSKEEDGDLTQIGWENLPENTKQLRHMLCFSLAICGIFYPDYQLAKKKKFALYCRYLKNGGRNEGSVALTPLQKFCRAFLEFFFQVASTHADGAPICNIINRNKLEELLEFARPDHVYTDAEAIIWENSLSEVLSPYIQFSFSELKRELNRMYDRNGQKAASEAELISEIYSVCQKL